MNFEIRFFSTNKGIYAYYYMFLQYKNHDTEVKTPGRSQERGWTQALGTGGTSGPRNWVAPWPLNGTKKVMQL